MKQRKLGANGPRVGAIGLGCMSFGGIFGKTDMKTSLRCLDAALDHGIDFLDVADIYGLGVSEQVIGEHLKSRPNPFKIATKGSITRNKEHPFDNSKDYLENALHGSFKRMGVDYVDLYYIHRREQSRPIEDVVETLQGFIKAGKIGGYGLSEVAPTTIRRAHAVHPVMAVQNEYSLWSRHPEVGVVQVCAQLGITFVPFSPVGRGVLTDTPPDPSAMAEDDFRLTIPRFQPENYADNLHIVEQFQDFAKQRGWTTSAAALAWILHRGEHLIPIPATRTAEHLAQWAGAVDIEFSAEDLAHIDHIMPIGWAYGDRYSPAQHIGPETYS